MSNHMIWHSPTPGQPATVGRAWDVILDHREVPFDEFLWRCARGDSPLADIKRLTNFGNVFPDKSWLRHFEGALTDDRVAYLRREIELQTQCLKGAHWALAQYKDMSNAEAETAFAAYLAQGHQVDKESADRRTLTLSRLARLRTQAADWIPPTPDHEPLKQFMIDYLDRCTAQCREVLPSPPPGEVTAHAWRAQFVAGYQKDVAETEEELRRFRAELERSEAWRAALWASVPEPAPPIGWRLILDDAVFEQTPVGLHLNRLDPGDPNRAPHVILPSVDFAPDGTPISEKGRALLRAGASVPEPAP